MCSVLCMTGVRMHACKSLPDKNASYGNQILFLILHEAHPASSAACVGIYAIACVQWRTARKSTPQQVFAEYA